MGGTDRIFIARHGETVFNAAGRMQGEHVHTPLTRAGFAQAEAMGAALRDLLGPKPRLAMWASPAGRALQTLAVIAEHLELDWHEARTDERLVEIGVGGWSGRAYAEIVAEEGALVDPATGLFLRRAPGGEWYDEIAARLSSWLDATAGERGDRLIVMHGMSSRVLRGLLTCADVLPQFGARVAAALPQGSVAMIAGGIETVVHRAAVGQAAPA